MLLSHPLNPLMPSQSALHAGKASFRQIRRFVDAVTLNDEQALKLALQATASASQGLVRVMRLGR